MILCAFIIINVACVETRAPGDWDPMELSDSFLYFGEEGGDNTVVCLNYPFFGIDYIIDSSNNYYYGEEKGRVSSCTAPGISVVKDGKQPLKVVVDPSAEQHRWGVCISHGDAFGSFAVYQNVLPED